MNPRSQALKSGASSASRRTFVGAAIATAAFNLACDAHPLTSRSSTMMAGVNLAGLEFAPDRLPGRLNTDYVAPDPSEIAYYRSAGATVIRLPFLWERLQPQLDGSFDEDYFASIALAVDQSESMSVILDAHQFGRRTVNGAACVIGESEVSSQQFATFWRNLASRFQHERRVIFGLMNEPHDQRTDVLVDTQNLAIGAIRAAGARQLILVSGNAWSGAHSWITSGNAAAMTAIRDPAANFAFDVHQYLDPQSSGAQFECLVGSGRRLAAFTQWLQAHQRKGFLGEFASGPAEVCMSELSTLLEHVAANADVWLGWTYWAGGAWWPEDYPLAIRPRSLQSPADLPQMRVLRRFLR